MSLNELKFGGCFPQYADPRLGYADNDLYRSLLESVESGNSLPVAGVSHPGIVCPLSGLHGVSNSGKPIGTEIARAEAAILDEDGSLIGLDYGYLQDGISDALIVAYLLDTSLCCVRKFSGEEALYTRSPVLIKAMAQPDGSFAFPEGYLKDRIDDQINSSEIYAVRIDIASGAFSLDKVSSVTDTVVPQFLLQVFARRLIQGLYDTSAEIAYSEAGNIFTYRVSLEEYYLREKFYGNANAYRRAAWAGKGPDLVLPTFRYDGEKEFRGLKLFSVFQIRDIEWNRP